MNTNTLKQGKKALGLTGTHATGGGRREGVETPIVNGKRGRPVNAKDSYPRRRKCKGCKEWFQPTRRGQVFHSKACGKAYWAREQKGKRGAKPKREYPIEPAICLHCQQPKWMKVGKGQKFCSSSHKVMASRIRRAATIQAYAEYTGRGLAACMEYAELHKNAIRAMQVFLSKKGLVYSYEHRAWVADVFMPVGVEVKGG
jgi:hypothetical protein